MLYGPWGVPPNAIKSVNVSPLLIPKPEFDLKAASNLIFGVLFGSL
jgi:hypothetical protein